MIGLAVGAERFTADASAIMDLLLRTQVDNGGVNLDDDDPQLSYMITAWARICQILGKNAINSFSILGSFGFFSSFNEMHLLLGPSFAPYLPMVMSKYQVFYSSLD